MPRCTPTYLSAADLSNLEVFADGPPHELSARLRAECPVDWNNTRTGPGFWSLTPGSDIMHVSANPGIFSSARGGIFFRPDALIPLEVGRRDFMLWKDPAEHTNCANLIGHQVVRGVDTLASTLAHPDAHGDRLSETEIAGFFTMLLFVGRYQPQNAISSAILALLEHFDQLELLRREPTRLRTMRSGLPAVALEELLRWSTPVNCLARTATQDTTLAVVNIKSGERLVMWYASASCDPDLFPGAERLDVTRAKCEPAHCAFGGGGDHYCQGAALTYRTLSVALREILRRLPGIELAGLPTHERSPFVTALTSLPVRFNRSDSVDIGDRKRELIRELVRMTGKRVTLRD